MSINSILVQNNHDLIGKSLTCVAQAANPGGAATLWVDSADGNLMFGTQDVSAAVVSVNYDKAVSEVSANLVVPASPGVIVTGYTALIASPNMNVATGVYTVPVGGAGVYRFSFLSNITPSVNAYAIGVRINAVNRAMFEDTATASVQVIVSGHYTATLADGDTAALFLENQVADGATSNTTPIQFTVEQLTTA